MSIEESQQTRIINNVLYDNKGQNGIKISKGNIGGDIICNNTIAYNALTPIDIGEGTYVKINNNIIAFNILEEPLASINSRGNIKANFNNLFQNKNSNGVVPDYNGAKSQSDIVKDPLFVDGPGRNLQLKRSSPGWGAGKDGEYLEITGMNLGADVYAKATPLKYGEQLDEGIALFKSRKFDESIKVLNRLLQVYPLNDDCLNAVGESYAAARDFGAAIESFKTAIRINPNNGVSLLNLANAQITAGKPNEALPLLDLALSKGVDEVKILIGKGDCHAALKKYETGIGFYQQALKIRYGDDPQICYKIAQAYSSQSKISDGMVWLDKALRYGVDKKVILSDPLIALLRQDKAFKDLKEKYGF
jgi:tetratricopeptide (TPR) repeat protein